MSSIPDVTPVKSNSGNAVSSGESRAHDQPSMLKRSPCFVTKKRDYGVKIPFRKHANLRHRHGDVTELIRSSCQKLMAANKYVEINYDTLTDYAKNLNEREVNADHKNVAKFLFNLNKKDLSERDIINLSCFIEMLQFGSQFRNIIQRYSRNHQDGESHMHFTRVGVRHMFKKYPKLDVNSLRGITVEEVAWLFDIDLSHDPSTQLRFVCDTVRRCICEVVHVLSIKRLNDFADYIYNHIDMAWIKSQTDNLSAIQTIQWELNDQHEIGLELAPTNSDIIRRCVVVGFTPTNYNNAACAELVEKRAFLYAINDEVVYNTPFNEILSKIETVLKTTNSIPSDRLDDPRVVALQFGLQLDAEPETLQPLLRNFINDFSSLNEQYLYSSFYGPNKHLRVYLFQKVQAIVMELYHNLYVKAPPDQKNAMFNFPDITQLTAVVDNVVPFVLLKDNVIQMKEEFKDDFNAHIDVSPVLKRTDFLVEIQVCALSAIELLLAQASSKDINTAQLTYYFRNKGNLPEYRRFESRYTRDAINIVY